jgi:membrane protease YdiL (CAAX protease family)
VSTTPADPPPAEREPATGPVAGPPADGPDPGSRAPAPGWLEIALGAVGYLVLSVLAGLLLAGTVAPGSPALAVVALGVAAVTALGAFAVAAGARVRWLPAFGVRSTTWRWLLLGLAGGVLAWLVNRAIIIGYVLISGDSSNPQAAIVPGATGGAIALVLTLLCGAVLVPIGEELLFRGVVTTALGRYGAWVAVLVSALVFALAHGVSIVLPAAVVLGVLNALMLRRSGSVWPGVVAHGVNNALVFGLTAILL